MLGSLEITSTIGLTPEVSTILLNTDFASELTESAYRNRRTRRNLIQPMPIHPFAAAAIWYGVRYNPTQSHSIIDQTEILEAYDETGSLPQEDQREGIASTHYPRFMPSKYERDLMREVKRITSFGQARNGRERTDNSINLPFFDRKSAVLTRKVFLAQCQKDNISVDPNQVQIKAFSIINDPNNTFYYLSINTSEHADVITPILYQVREMLGTNMSPRQAYYFLQQIHQMPEQPSQGLVTKAQAETIKNEYHKQFSAMNRCERENVFIFSNGTAALRETLLAISTRNNVGNDHSGNFPNILTVGVPYSDTPKTVKKVTGNKPLNCRSNDVGEIIAAIEQAKSAGKKIDMILLELVENPTLATTDIAALNKYTAQNGIDILVDVTVCSSFAVDMDKLFRLKSVIGAVTSTTKYGSGTIMGGAFFVNPNHPKHKSVKLSLAHLKDQVNMFWADAAIHLRDLPSQIERLKIHSENAKRFIEVFKNVDGVTINYPPESSPVKRFLKKGMGFGGVVSLEFDRTVYTEQQIQDIINELPEQMSVGLSFGLPVNNALPYAAVVFENKTKEQSGVDPLIVRVSFGNSRIASLKASTAIKSAIAKVVGKIPYRQSTQRSQAATSAPSSGPAIKQ